MNTRWKIAAAALLLIAIGIVASALFRESIPGTFRRDDHGFPHGTGTEVFTYKSGQTMGVEKYVRGQLVRSEWFRPDGTSIQVTEWKDGAGEGLYLRQDGTIWCRMTYAHGIWDGPCTYYNRDGTIRGTATAKNGQRTEGYQPEPGERER